jgi:hypothetical protein
LRPLYATLLSSGRPGYANATPNSRPAGIPGLEKSPPIIVIHTPLLQVHFKLFVPLEQYKLGKPTLTGFKATGELWRGPGEGGADQNPTVPVSPRLLRLPQAHRPALTC